MADKTDFLSVFPCCAGLGDLCGGLKDAYLTGVLVDRAALTMNVSATFARQPAPAELQALFPF